MAVAAGDEESVMVHPNETVIRNLYDAFATSNMVVVNELLMDDVTWHAPGTAQHAGIRRGKAELFATMGRLAELTSGTLRSDVVDVLANDERAVVIQLTHAQRPDRPPLEDREVIVFQLRDGRVAEVWEHPGDLRQMDAFFA
jgi:ketosteroid isomerase-like protein